MNAGGKRRDLLPLYTAVLLGVGMVALWGAYFFSKDPFQRLAAFIGVAEAEFSGLVALPLKRLAVEKSLSWALGVMGVVFGLRIVLVTAGLFYVVHTQLSALAYVIGFFGVYFVLQWIEVSYVLAENRRGQGGM